jgi:nuclear pore complex protein Nup93
LAASGISPLHALRDLRALDSQAAVLSPFKQADSFDPDNEKFIRNIQQRGRQTMVAESLARVHREFDNFLEEKVNLNWDEQRRKIFQHFGLSPKDEIGGDYSLSKGSFGRTTTRQSNNGARPSGARSVFGRSALEKSVIGPPGNPLVGSQLFMDPNDRTEATTNQSPDTRFLREKMGYFADKVKSLSGARLDDRPFPIFHEFAAVEEHAGGDVSARPPDHLHRLRDIGSPAVVRSLPCVDLHHQRGVQFDKLLGTRSHQRKGIC